MLQGDTLAPYLFVIVIDYVMHMATVIENNEPSLGLKVEDIIGHDRSRTQRAAEFITNFSYADDIILFSSNLVDNQKLLSKVERFASEVGLLINFTITEYIFIGEDHDPNIQLRVNAGLIKKVIDFKYLGSWIMNSTKEISTRIGAAWTAAKKNEYILALATAS